ncbi:MAG: hypothetical protein K1Y36_24485 [Blastocatellia bacterium]|nr:hypothetical protein [Blastocatellia bacterium]
MPQTKSKRLPILGIAHMIFWPLWAAAAVFFLYSFEQQVEVKLNQNQYGWVFVFYAIVSCAIGLAGTLIGNWMRKGELWTLVAGLMWGVFSLYLGVQVFRFINRWAGSLMILFEVGTCLVLILPSTWNLCRKHPVQLTN